MLKKTYFSKEQKTAGGSAATSYRACKGHFWDSCGGTGVKIRENCQVVEMGIDFICICLCFCYVCRLPSTLTGGGLRPPPQWGRPSAAPIVDSIEGAGEAANIRKHKQMHMKSMPISTTWQFSRIFTPVPPQLTSSKVGGGAASGGFFVFQKRPLL